MKICEIEGCGKPVKKNSKKYWCAMHTNRFYRHGDVNITKHVKSGGICTVDGCYNSASVSGFCYSHYHKIQRYDDVNVTLAEKQKGKVCQVDDCFYPAYSKGYCQTHYKTHFKYDRDYTIIAPKGSGTITKDGYREFTINGERILEHVMIVEKALGKKLPEGAVVHHINEDKLDNSPTNLILCQDQTYHMLLHKRMKDLNINFKKYENGLSLNEFEP